MRKKLGSLASSQLVNGFCSSQSLLPVGLDETSGLGCGGLVHAL